MNIQRIVFIGMLLLTGLQMNAQKLVIDKGKQQVFIECTTDMPSGTYAPFSNVAARWSNPTVYGSSTVGLASLEANAVVSQKFQIASRHVALNGTPQADGFTMKWNEAMGIDVKYNTSTAVGVLSATTTTGCAGYWEGSQGDSETGRGKWRLPTQREIQLILIFNDKLNDIDTFSNFSSFISGSYWISMEGEESVSNAWYGFVTTYYAAKTSYFCVRCVRDVAP